MGLFPYPCAKIFKAGKYNLLPLGFKMSKSTGDPESMRSMFKASGLPPVPHCACGGQGEARGRKLWRISHSHRCMGTTEKEGTPLSRTRSPRSQSPGLSLLTLLRVLWGKCPDKLYLLRGDSQCRPGATIGPPNMAHRHGLPA